MLMSLSNDILMKIMTVMMVEKGQTLSTGTPYRVGRLDSTSPSSVYEFSLESKWRTNIFPCLSLHPMLKCLPCYFFTKKPWSSLKETFLEANKTPNVERILEFSVNTQFDRKRKLIVKGEEESDVDFDEESSTYDFHFQVHFTIYS